jgi:hypothetical protein
MSTSEIAPSVSPQAPSSRANYSYALAYLKTFIVVLVVAHHAALAYHPSAPPLPLSLLAQPRVWQAYPVVDSHRAVWAALLATFNDVFFMALMFFVSGLFVWRSFERKGEGAYLRDRLLRLGLPFLPAAVILAPLAYYPTYLQMRSHGGFGDFLRQWMALGTWSAGPVWFCWVLLVFDLIMLWMFRMIPRCGERLGGLAGRLSDRPSHFFIWLVAITAAVYVPLALLAGPFNWTFLGPFGFQTSRILLYFIYFVAGIGVGAWGLERGLLAAKGELSRQWPVWVLRTVLAFLAFAVALQAAVSRGPQPTIHTGIPSAAWIAALLLFPVSCAASSFAFLAVFVRFFQQRIAALEGLSRDAYGIFLLHFAFVSWFGYALLPAALPALIKFLMVTFGAVALSWTATLLLRRIPGVGRVL